MAEGVGRRIASSPITADWLVSEALRRYPTTGEIFVQMTRLRTPVRAIACPDSAGLTVGACAARNRIAVTSYTAASIQELIAAGPRAGHPVRRLRTAAAVGDGEKLRCARLEGFSLHAKVALDARAREQLEHLCRYLLRPPLALDRLTESPHGQLPYQLPHPRRDGATHLLLDPLELIEKLCVLIAPPRFHLLRFHGVLAPRSRLRSDVVPRSRRDPEHGGGPQLPAPSAPETRPTPSCAAGSLSWAALMKRVFAIDVLLCSRCGGRRRVVALYSGGSRLRDLLDRLELSQPPGLPPPQGVSAFDSAP
jgi:hypothetical protein